MTAERGPEKKANGSAGSTEEEIIELTDVVPDTAEDEGIIELTDAIPAAAEDDGEIIELVDEVAAGAADDAPVAASESHPESAMDAAGEMTTDAEAAPTGFAGSDLRIADEIEEDLENEERQDDFVDSLGMDLETNAAIDRIPEDAGSGLELPLSGEKLAEPASSEQIEAAVERVLLKILPERIDSILREAIEKALTSEIDKIKEILLEGSTGGS